MLLPFAVRTETDVRFIKDLNLSVSQGRQLLMLSRISRHNKRGNQCKRRNKSQ